MDIYERVRCYAADALGESCLNGITSVARFDAGDRHAVFRVTYIDAHGRTNDAVVRVSTRDDGAERVQAEREAAVLKKLQGVGAPRLYDYRNESRWFDTPATCMQFIEGEQRELVSAPREDVESLGAVVASVHNLPVDDLADWFPGPRTTRRIRQCVAGADRVVSAEVARSAAAIRSLSSSLDYSRRPRIESEDGEVSDPGFRFKTSLRE